MEERRERNAQEVLRYVHVVEDQVLWEHPLRPMQEEEHKVHVQVSQVLVKSQQQLRREVGLFRFCVM